MMVPTAKLKKEYSNKIQCFIVKIRMEQASIDLIVSKDHLNDEQNFTMTGNGMDAQHNIMDQRNFHFSCTQYFCVHISIS